MDFHAFMYVTIGRRHELERGMAGKDPVLYRRMLDEIAEYARTCDATGWSGIGVPTTCRSRASSSARTRA
jgi:hypothetical protein